MCDRLHVLWFADLNRASGVVCAGVGLGMQETLLGSNFTSHESTHVKRQLTRATSVVNYTILTKTRVSLTHN